MRLALHSASSANDRPRRNSTANRQIRSAATPAQSHCQSEGHQCNRIRGDSGANGDGSLDQHLANGDVFENGRLPHQHTAASEECRVRPFRRFVSSGDNAQRDVDGRAPAVFLMRQIIDNNSPARSSTPKTPVPPKPRFSRANRDSGSIRHRCAPGSSSTT
jgi:hypothetical protein